MLHFYMALFVLVKVFYSNRIFSDGPGTLGHGLTHTYVWILIPPPHEGLVLQAFRTRPWDEEQTWMPVQGTAPVLCQHIAVTPLLQLSGAAQWH